MPQLSIELNAKRDVVGLPIIWRLGKLFNVVTNIRRARITEDYGYVALDLEGSTAEVEQATEYLRALNILTDQPAKTPSAAVAAPEKSVAQTSAIFVRLSTVNAQQGHEPILYRVGKDVNVVVNLETALFDEEEGGNVEVTLSGALIEVQRAIAYLHTTGLSVSPRQRSVTDLSNL